MKTATYSLLMMRPDLERVDVLCVGAVVLDADGHWHLPSIQSDEKLRVVGGSGAAAKLRLMLGNVEAVLQQLQSFAEARALLAANSGVLSLHEFEGVFSYVGDADFARQLRTIMQESVLAPEEPATVRTPARVVRRQHTRARLRRYFESMGIMGDDAADIEHHKVVRKYPVSAEHGLTADFALRNTVMHITETVDFVVSEESVRGKLFEAQAKCLVMRAARDKFGAGTECYVVVSGAAAPHAAQSVGLLSSTARLFAVENSDDISEYLDRIAVAARMTGQLRRT